MEFKKVTAIVRINLLEAVEKRLRQLGVRGITVSEVKGYGEYKQFFTRDGLSEEARIEIFATKDEVDAIVRAILESAHTGSAGDGLIAVMPVEKIFRIKSGSEALPTEI
ncbi:MAG: P-II family nitrogen regulator [Syntrophobacteraceae bacterium]